MNRNIANPPMNITGVHHWSSGSSKVEDNQLRTKEVNKMGSMMGATERVVASPKRWSGVTIDAVARNSDKTKKLDMKAKITKEPLNN